MATYVFINKNGDNLKEEQCQSYGCKVGAGEDYRSLHISNKVCQNLLLPVK